PPQHQSDRVPPLADIQNASQLYQGDELTLVAGCRDDLRVVSAKKGTRYDEE
ncbi:MAG: hypothetical protein ACI9PP_000818, partial [Halobacteriales archaeon]